MLAVVSRQLFPCSRNLDRVCDVTLRGVYIWCVCVLCVSAAVKAAARPSAQAGEEARLATEEAEQQLGLRQVEERLHRDHIHRVAKVTRSDNLTGYWSIFNQQRKTKKLHAPLLIIKNWSGYYRNGSDRFEADVSSELRQGGKRCSFLSHVSSVFSLFYVTES